MVTGRKAFKPF